MKVTATKWAELPCWRMTSETNEDAAAITSLIDTFHDLDVDVMPAFLLNDRTANSPFGDHPVATFPQFPFGK